MTCTTCPHLGCPRSYLQQGVMPCPECEAGTVVLDPVSAPRWRLDCNLCSFLIYLPPSLHSASVAASECPVRLLPSPCCSAYLPAPQPALGLHGCLRVPCAPVAWLMLLCVGFKQVRQS